eukprot:SAG31_NODE_172_length_21357_cov_7.616021_1_plen_57_part_00
MWFLCTTIFFPVLLAQNHFEDMEFCALSCEFTKKNFFQVLLAFDVYTARIGVHARL